jgi:hypothetical protein
MHKLHNHLGTATESGISVIRGDSECATGCQFPGKRCGNEEKHTSVPDLAIVPKLVNQVGLGHADTSIADRKNFVLLVGSDTDIQLLVRVDNRGIGQRRASEELEMSSRRNIPLLG